jgi:hypothetical protein
MTSQLQHSELYSPLSFAVVPVFMAASFIYDFLSHAFGIPNRFEPALLKDEEQWSGRGTRSELRVMSSGKFTCLL